jgi:hypothetical protein
VDDTTSTVIRSGVRVVRVALWVVWKARVMATAAVLAAGVVLIAAVLVAQVARAL